MRHEGAARAAARAITSSMDPEDLASEAFTKVFSAIQRGHGPTDAFRPYLYATIRNIAAGLGRKAVETPLEYIGELASETAPDPFEQVGDRWQLTQVFQQLPERWRELLWYTEVEGMKPREIAPLLGLTSNAVSALAYRAREGFREAWLRHTQDAAESEECRWVRDRLRAGEVARRDRERFTRHLDECAACREIAAINREPGKRLRALLLPLFLGSAASAAVVGSDPSTSSAADANAPVHDQLFGDTAGAASARVRPLSARPAHLVVGGVVAVALAGSVFAAASTWIPPREQPRPESTGAAQPDPVEPSAPRVVPTEPPASEAAVPAPSESPDPDDRGTPEPEPGRPATPPPTAPTPDPAPTREPTPTPSPTPMPSPSGHTPVVTAPRQPELSRIDTQAPVFPLLRGTGEPGANIRILDERGEAIASTVVTAQRTFEASVGEERLRQGMTIIVEQSVAGVAGVQRSAPVGPFLLPTPVVQDDGAPAAVYARVDGDDDGFVDDVRLTVSSHAGYELRVARGERVDVHSLTLTGVESILLLDVSRGPQDVTLSYGSRDGRRGVPVTVRIVITGAGSSSGARVPSNADLS